MTGNRYATKRPPVKDDYARATEHAYQCTDEAWAALTFERFSEAYPRVATAKLRALWDEATGRRIGRSA